MLLKQYIEPMTKVRGFLGMGIFTPKGEMLDRIISPNSKMHKEGVMVGPLVNDILLSSKKVTEMLGFVGANFVELDTEEGTLIARCFNDNKNKHFHAIVMIKNGGNVAMARILLETSVENISREFNTK